MNLQVPPELEAKLTRLAAETGRTVDRVALEARILLVGHRVRSGRRLLLQLRQRPQSFGRHEDGEKLPGALGAV